MERLRMKKNKKIYKKLLIMGIALYVIFTLGTEEWGEVPADFGRK